MRTNRADLTLSLFRVMLCLFSAQALFAQTKVEALELGKTISGELTGGQTNPFAVTLQSGQYMRVAVMRPGFATVIRLSDATVQAALVELHWPGAAGRTEPICWVAKTTGDYLIELVAPEQGVTPDKYEIGLVELRGALPDDQKRIEAQQLLDDGRSFEKQGAYEQSIAAYERVLVQVREIKDRERESATLTRIGSAFATLGRSDRAIDYYERALPIYREIGDQFGEGEILNGLGDACTRTGQNDKAIGYHEKALAIFHEMGNQHNQGESLQGLGSAYMHQGQHEKALTFFEQALKLRRALKDRLGEARALGSIGNTYRATSQTETAIGYYEQTLTIASELKNRRLEGTVLDAIAVAYNYLSQWDKAIDYDQQALAIFRDIKYRQMEGKALLGIGLGYFNESQYEKAIEYYEQALPIAREVKDREIEGFTVNNLVEAYSSLGQHDKTIDYLEQALSIARETGERNMESLILWNLASEYQRLHKVDQAVRYSEQALAIVRGIKDRNGEARVLDNLGAISGELGDYHKAIAYEEQALTIAREVKDRQTEGMTLNDLGDAWRHVNQPEKAAVAYEQALPVFREIKGSAFESATLLGLMEVWKTLNQPRLAVFYGKQSVNAIQSIRSSIRGLSQDLQKSFLRENEKGYHALAELLITLGRLIEAQQVVNLLKEQEFLDYVRRDERSAGPSGRADWTTEESQWAERYRAASEILVAKGVQMDDLQSRIRKLPVLMDDPTIKEQIASLQKDLEAGTHAFQEYLAELKQHFAAKPESGATQIDLRDVEAFKSDLAELKHGAVVIYTLVTTDRYRVMLVTPQVQRAYESVIKSEELNRKIDAFRVAAENPRSDPREVAHELYKILIPPALAHDLQEAKAQTLMWSLDGSLRYVPIAALYDGKQYLIEKYRVAVFTAASQSRLKEPPKTVWRVAGFGVTQPHEGFTALPSVAAEMAGVVRETPREPGVLDGRRLLDNQFTRTAMEEELIKGYQVVHVASHFSFRPGDETHSFLLLGDGGRFSLADLKNADTLFAGVDLLTLSACSTGLGDIRTFDGSEVESFGVLAQRKGAKAVVASLWPVADVSTALLMREFYRIRQTKRAVTKLDALRESQLELLHGKFNTESAISRERGLIHDPPGPTAPQDFRHPYFWAPFFLMGNWL